MQMAVFVGCVGSHAVSECPITSTAFLRQQDQLKIAQVLETHLETPVLCSSLLRSVQLFSNTKACLYVNASHQPETF